MPPFGRIAVAVVLTLWAFLPSLAQSHDLGLAQIKASQTAATSWTLRIKVDSTLRILKPPSVPAACEMSDSRHSRPSKDFQSLAFSLTCGPDALADGAAMRLPWPLQGALLTTHALDAGDRTHFIRAEASGVTVALASLVAPSQGFWETARAYLVLGIEHILGGFDHLALVLCLCLIASGRRLLIMVTAFTLGHSLTLSAAALGHVSLPPGPVEACIALSIVLLARDAVLGRDANRQTYWMIALFGLLHGLGFAGALGEIGLPPDQTVLALVAFNLGVEIGQIAFVAVALGAGAAAARLRLPRRGIAMVTACVIGAVATAWTIERSAAVFLLA